MKRTRKNKKRVKTTNFCKTDFSLLEWFTGIRNTRPDVAVSGLMRQEKANALGRLLGEVTDKFTIDASCIHRWKLRHGVSTKKMGVYASVSDLKVDEWQKRC